MEPIQDTDDGVPCVVGIDVGGTDMKAAVATLRGRVLIRRRWRTEASHGPHHVLARMVGLATELIDAAHGSGHEPLGVGIAVPGQVDETSGVAIRAVNLGWRDLPVGDELGAACGLPVAVRHDIRAGASAEARLGAGRDHENFVFLPIGTGIGCAIVLDRRPFVGEHFAAGEIGHLAVCGASRQCACGRTDCLEATASAAAIARRYSELSGRPTAAAKTVLAAAQAGEPLAAEVWADAVDAIARALVASKTLLDIDTYVIGGGLSMAGPRLLQPLGRAVAKYIDGAAAPVLTVAQLGDEAGCIGAALSIADRLHLPGTCASLSGR